MLKRQNSVSVPGNKKKLFAILAILTYIVVNKSIIV